MTPTHRVNGWGDLAFDGDVKQYIGQDVELVKVCKSGLYQFRAADGSLHTVPKRNMDVLPIRPPVTEHACPKTGCPVMLPRHLLCCGDHWFAIPVVLRRAVNQEWAAGRGTLTDGYLAAREAAIAALNADNPAPSTGDLFGVKS